jgi:beta-galactosidase
METTLHQHRQGDCWLDSDQNHLNAHGAGFLKVGDTTYIFGEYKQGETVLTEHVTSWDAYYMEPVGFSCYSSKDLHSWKFEGLAFDVKEADGAIPEVGNRITERPKVIYNEKTGKYVLWFHVDNREYEHAHVGTATSDSPTGPFHFERSFQPNGCESRDFTLFKDDDGTAYIIYSSESNMTLHIARLTDDYLDCVRGDNRIFVEQQREAPAVFKYNGGYYMITSGCTGWDPNPSMLASADSMMGDWKELCYPFHGPGAETSFQSQCTYVFPLDSEKGRFLMAADRWKKTDLGMSGYIWLPFELKGKDTKIVWSDFYP